jgi:hypothetical protein
LDVPRFDDDIELKRWLMDHQTPLKMIERREGRGGQEFHYVRHQYITQVLNQICGHNWDFEILREDVREDQIWVLGKLTIRVHDHQIVKQQYGSASVKTYSSGDNAGEMMSLGDDLKAAASDALKKCASMIGLGLDLSIPVRSSTLRKLHAVGNKVFEDTNRSWDEMRSQIIRAITRGQKASSKDLTDAEARIIIGMLQQHDAPIVKEARRRLQ